MLMGAQNGDLVVFSMMIYWGALVVFSIVIDGDLMVI